MYKRARAVFVGIRGWRLRYPRVQLLLNTEELAQRQLATWLEDRTQAPSEKEPTQNCLPAPSRLRWPVSDRAQWPRRKGLLLGYRGKCPVQESHCDVL